jgi:vacuolar-type H+-ATPase catalytic subunit A/Vma1
MSTITDSIKQSRAPALNVDNFMLYQVVMKSWLKRFQGADEALLEEPVKKTLDAEDINPTLNARGLETEATAVLRKSHEESYRTWTNKNNMAYSALVESCSSNEEAMVLVMEMNTANARDLWTAIVNKFNKQYLSIKQQAVADFNSLFVRPNESLPDFIIRIKQARLKLLNMGVQMNEDMDLMGRLKSGISIDKRFENVVTNLTFNDYTWEQAIQKIDSIKKFKWK